MLRSVCIDLLFGFMFVVGSVYVFAGKDPDEMLNEVFKYGDE